MLSLRSGLRQTQTTSAVGLRSALSSQRSRVTELLQTNLIHQHYLNQGGRNGPFGFPISEVQFLGTAASRQFRGGEIRLLEGKVPTSGRNELSVRFLGFRCLRESDHDQSSPHDEPYFIISADIGNGAPAVKKFGPFEGVGTGTEIGVAEFLIKGVAPDPLAIRVAAYENDRGDPDETAKKIQEEVIKLSQQAASLASLAGAADGPGVGVGAAASTVGAIFGGPIGALIAAGIVTALGLGDDFINQAATLVFARPDNISTPPTLGQFQGTNFNAKISVNGGDEGEYDLFFDVLNLFIPPPVTA